ncbi:MAG TPA: antitoxin VbhA family protein [Sporichthyaceae bacterium]|nr:antitoxin VbhA family protein [Sporichthyaceae bacterium]
MSTPLVVLPEVLSAREFRAGPAATLQRVRAAGDVVFVGAHRRAEAVVMSVERYEALAAAAERQHAVAAAMASVRAEGLEPSPEDLELLVAVAAGELTTDKLRARVLRRYGR